ncbi:MAG: TIGR03111 family XrtG-associated glycosyltransferase, partial [Lachnospiraceae bacterium]
MDIINRLINSIVFWSAWMIIPFIMEVIPAIGSIIVLFRRKKKPVQDEKPILYPEISVIIPVYNSEGTLEACIRSIYDSDYPNDRIRVFLVNNKSKDNSFRVFSECQEKYPELIMQWLNAQQGKSRALNLALYNSEGKYIIHIDSDGILEKSALRHMVERFEADLSVNCMTGAICTNPEMIETYPKGFPKLLRKLEFVEYAQAFLAGRNYASEKNAIYTLSGAFSGFRKSAILKSWLYSTDTICEDTQITFQMKYIQKEKVKLCEKAIFFVDPIEDVDKLYTQRQRWQRGSLEVTKMFMKFGLNPLKLVKDTNVRTIMYDHTFAFPRLIWYLALICLLFMGFSGKIIGLSMAGIMVMYIICGYFYYFAIIGFLSEFKELCNYYKKQWWVIPFLPLFNFVVFFIRMAGIINSIEADSAWKTRTLTEEREAFKNQVKEDFHGLISVIEWIRKLVNDPPEKVKDIAKKSILWYVMLNILYLLFDILFIVTHWVNQAFAVGLNEIINTLLSPLKGTNPDVVISAVKYCVPRILLLYVPFATLSVFCRQKQKKFIREREAVSDSRPFILTVLQQMTAVISVCSMLLCIFYINATFDVVSYVKNSIGKTALYEQYYVAPKDVAIVSHGQKKNLLYIYLESMETTYASYEDGGHQEVNYIPSLKSLAEQNISFSNSDKLGGFHSGTGSDGTMAALFSTTTGVPYPRFAGINTQGGKDFFTPGITALGDILEEFGYTQEFLCGSDAEFGGRI